MTVLFQRAAIRENTPTGNVGLWALRRSIRPSSGLLVTKLSARSSEATVVFTLRKGTLSLCEEAAGSDTHLCVL